MEGRLDSTTSPPERRFTDQPHAVATLIGPGTLIRGDVRSTGPVEIRGTLEGDCLTSARCIVHEGGRVLGNIDAAALVVAGKVEAGLLKADKVELRVSASVEGDDPRPRARDRRRRLLQGGHRVGGCRGKAPCRCEIAGATRGTAQPLRT